jgi:hypothetical protein
MGTCVLVLGLPRSGTSCIAGILHNLGVHMGDDLFESDPEWNAKGFFVDRIITEALELINENDPITWTLPIDSNNDGRLRIRRIIQDRMSRGIIWGVKNHLIGFLADEFLNLPDIKLIITQRPLEKSKESWRARANDPNTEERYAKLIEVHNAQLAIANVPKLIVEFDQLVDNSEITIQGIANFVGLPVNENALKFVDSSLRRF